MPRDNMGLGELGRANLTFKKKFRWTLRIDPLEGGNFPPVSENFVKTAARPNISIDETEINFLNGVGWIPGKARWQTINVTYEDVATQDLAGLYDWLANVYDYTDSNRLYMGSKRQDYAGIGTLTLYDGCGQEIEEWKLKNLWPTSINFGDLDMSSSDNAMIELTLRYSQVEYRNICPGFAPSGKCSPC